MPSSMWALQDSQLVLRCRGVHLAIGRGGVTPVFVLAALFATLAARVGLDVATAAAVGGVGGAASLIVHELGHVHAARRIAGVRPLRISLIWVGAATWFEGNYARGRDQAKVAMGGPEASMLLALTLITVAALPLPVGLKQLIVALAFFNVAIAAVNLLPARPFDGHKVLTGILWCATGSENKARLLIHRIGCACVAAEISIATLLLYERPRLGVVACVGVTSLLAQQRLMSSGRRGSARAVSGSASAAVGKFFTRAHRNDDPSGRSPQRRLASPRAAGRPF